MWLTKHAYAITLPQKLRKVIEIYFSNNQPRRKYQQSVKCMFLSACCNNYGTINKYRNQQVEGQKSAKKQILVRISTISQNRMTLKSAYSQATQCILYYQAIWWRCWQFVPKCQMEIIEQKSSWQMNKNDGISAICILWADSVEELFPR